MLKKLLFSSFLFLLLSTTTSWANYTCSVIKTDHHDNRINPTQEDQGGVFSLKAFKDALYIGMFGYNSDNEPIIYKYDTAVSNKITETDLTRNRLGKSESICDMEVFGDYLYAGTESAGKIFRSADGNTWEQVHDDSLGLVCGLTVHNGKIFAAVSEHQKAGTARRGKIISSYDGINWDRRDSYPDAYLREIISYNGVLYAFSTDKNKTAYIHRSNDGENWATKNISYRFMRATVNDGVLWLGSSSGYSNNDTIEIFKQNEAYPNLDNFENNLQEMYADSNSYAITYVKSLRLANGQEILVAGNTNNWKNRQSGKAKLLLSEDGGISWNNICSEISEDAIWAIEEYKGQLYIGTMENGEKGQNGYGKLYRLDVALIQPAQADLDGDGKTEPIKIDQGYYWSYTLSSTGETEEVQWGLPGDIPVPKDYDGDSEEDIAVWRPAEGNWYIRNDNGSPYQWGLDGDIPVPADYNGDGHTQLAVWRPTDGYWYIQDGSPQNYDDPANYHRFQWGLDGDIPVPGDYNGDGNIQLAVWRPTDGYWYIQDGSPQNYYDPADYHRFQWGLDGDIPVPGDYSGNGYYQLAVWRPTEANWYIQNGLPQSYDPELSYQLIRWGLEGDKPFSADYDGDGQFELAVWRGDENKWYIAPHNSVSFDKFILIISNILE
jgi:hypothetical protein